MSTIFESGSIRRVKAIKIHPQYNQTAYIDYDVAVVHLKAPFVLSQKIRAIPLATTQANAGLVGIVTGFGKTESGTASTELRATRLTISSYASCVEAVGKYMTPRMFCTLVTGKMSRPGDSGGPFVANGQVYGIVSWGYDPPNYANGYTNVYVVRAWIETALLI